MDAAPLLVTLAQIGAGVRSGGLPSFAEAPDWMAVLELASQHRVAPLVWQALHSLPAGEVPASILAGFEMQMWRSSAARLLCEHALGDLLATLSAHGIEVVVLKGASLAHQLYPRPDLRPYHDLDILCRPADYPMLTSTLLAEGYRSEEPTEHPGTGRLRDTSRRRNFVSPSGDVEIEVHLDILGLGLPERRGEWWRAVQMVEAGPLELRTLDPLHQLLHLAVHLHAHCYSRLLWLIDLDLLIRRHAGALDWAQLMALARDEGVGSVLRHVLVTAHALLGTPRPWLPPPTLEERVLGGCYRALWPRTKVRRLERTEHRRLLRFDPVSGDPRDVAYSLLLLGRRREKWHALRQRRSAG